LPAVRSIILKKQDRGEADELVKFFSLELGWLTGVAKNAKKSRIRFGGHLEPLSLVDMTLRARKKDDMVWIDESQVIRGFMAIRNDIGKLARAAYFLELASVFIPEGQPDEAVFAFELDFLETLEEAELNPFLLLREEMLLLGLLGYAPRFDLCPACGKVIESGQDALFSVSLGGACHPACLSRGEEKRLVLSPDTLAVVRRGLKVDRDLAHRLRLHRKGIVELRQVLSAFVRYLRGEQINSLLFLETMGL